MVRLEDQSTDFQKDGGETFQFQNGTIRRTKSPPKTAAFLIFQFQNGTIRRKNNRLIAF